MVQEDIYNYSPKEGEREERRDKKRRPRMQISGRGVVNLARMIAARGRPVPKKKKKR